MPGRSEYPESRTEKSTGGTMGIATPAVSRWAKQACIPNPFAAKWFGSPSNAWARQIYRPLGRICARLAQLTGAGGGCSGCRCLRSGGPIRRAMHVLSSSARQRLTDSAMSEQSKEQHESRRGLNGGHLAPFLQELRTEGLSLRRIAERLNAEGHAPAWAAWRPRSKCQRCSRGLGVTGDV